MANYVIKEMPEGMGNGNYSTASRELAKLVADPTSGIAYKGAGSHKFWVRRK